MPHAQLGELSVWYETHGGGTPVLMIMGLTVSGRAWRHQIPDLAAQHRVAVFDNRGCGESDAPRGAYSTQLMADDAVALADLLGWERFHVVGVSMGGMIAQQLALQNRERVLSLALIATHAGGSLLHWRPSARALYLLGLAQLRSGPARIRAMAELLFPSDFLANADRTWLDEVMEADYGRPPSADGRRGQLAAVRAHDTRDRLPELGGLPTLVVRPGSDILVPPSASDFLHATIPGAELLHLPHAGHGVIRQTPDALNAALLTHLAAADG